MILRAFCLGAVLLLCFPAPTKASDDLMTVNLKIHCQVKSDQPDPQRPVFIWSETQPASTEPPVQEPLEIGFSDGQWTTRTFVARVPRTLSIDPKADYPLDLMDEMQGVFVDPRQKRIEIKRTKTTKLPLRFTSAISARAQGYALFLNHDCGAVTDQNWDATIHKMHPGEHVLRLWQEDIGYIPDIEPSDAYTIDGRGKIRLTVNAATTLTIPVRLKHTPSPNNPR